VTISSILTGTAGGGFPATTGGWKVKLSSTAASIGITGTPAGIVHQDATDQLFVNGGAGNDTIDASAVVRAPQAPSS